MKELLESITRSLVDHPEMVRINAVSGQSSIVFEIRVAPEDMGKIIGRGGKNANAVRTILQSVAAKEHRRCTLEILE